MELNECRNKLCAIEDALLRIRLLGRNDPGWFSSALIHPDNPMLPEEREAIDYLLGCQHQAYLIRHDPTDDILHIKNLIESVAYPIYLRNYYMARAEVLRQGQEFEIFRLLLNDIPRTIPAYAGLKDIYAYQQTKN